MVVMTEETVQKIYDTQKLSEFANSEMKEMSDKLSEILNSGKLFSTVGLTPTYLYDNKVKAIYITSEEYMLGGTKFH